MIYLIMLYMYMGYGNESIEKVMALFIKCPK